MPLMKLTFRPGVNTQFTPTLLEAGWTQSNLIRFRDGLVEKVKGWLPVIQGPFVGVCRGLHSWTQLSGFPDLGVGTNLKLFLLQGGQLFDLTPVRASGTLGNNPFATT